MNFSPERTSVPKIDHNSNQTQASSYTRKNAQRIGGAVRRLRCGRDRG